MHEPDRTRRPNILVIQADQLTPGALSTYGNTVTKTPNINKLASDGVVFENAYCNSPLCAPSRFSMLTGQLASKIGAYDNSAELTTSTPTMAHYFRKLNYTTYLSGKMHFIGADQLHGFEERLTTDIYPADFGWTPDWETPDLRPSWYHNMLSVVQAGKCEVTNQLDFDEEAGFKANRKLSEIARNGNENPFFMVVSFTHPHDPYATPEKYWDLYPHEEIDMPKTDAFTFDEMDQHSKRLYEVCAMGEYTLTPERVRNARHAYYGNVSYVDDKVGQLIKTLESHGLRENTIIVFTSDHGDMLGERGLWYKMSFFEGAVRVPLIFNFPKKFSPKRISENVSLVDLLPTLVGFADPKENFQFADNIDGKDLNKLLLRAEKEAKAPEFEERPVISEMFCEGTIAPQIMIRYKNLKYIFSGSDPEQLYDLEKDPRELKNQANEESYKEKLEFFRAQLTVENWDVKKLHKDVVESQRRRRFIGDVLKIGKRFPWDFNPREDASNMYMRNHLDLNVLERTARFPSPSIPPVDGEPRKEYF